MICLDTNAVIAAMTPHTRVRARLEDALVDRIVVGMPTIVLFEMWYGIEKSAKRPENAAGLAEFLRFNLTHWPFDPDDARDAGEIRALLRRAGTPIGPYDVLIAAQARRRSAVLVTANTREYSRVPGLQVEDWAAPP
jgi:tRNA(fMet)-specific endonuclease VapC